MVGSVEEINIMIGNWQIIIEVIMVYIPKMVYVPFIYKKSSNEIFYLLPIQV